MNHVVDYRGYRFFQSSYTWSNENDEDEDYYGKKYGPNKFFSINNSSDEEAVTCEGMLRMVEVELETSEIEKDWGCDTKFARYYPDALKLAVD